MLPGSNTLLVGATGTGKTHCIGTLLGAGIKPFVLFTEPGVRTLAPLIRDKKIHYKYVKPAAPSWADMADNAKKINQMSFAALTKLTDLNKSKYGQWMEVITTMNDFVCDCCGKSWGDVADWQTDRAICVDSLSGLNIMAMDLVVGAKPVKAPGDWGVAMDNLERFINNMTAMTQCHFVMTAHLEREKDELTGGIHLMASTLGQKLSPKIPRFFDDVVMCQNKEGSFSWTTAAANVDLKSRNLPLNKTLKASFVELIDSWKEAGGEITETKEV